MAGRTPLIRRPKYRCALFRFQKCPVSSPSLQNYTLLFLFSGTTLLFKPLSRSGGWKKPLSPPHFRSPSFRNELMHRRHPFRSIMQKSNQQFISLKKGERRVSMIIERGTRRVWIFLKFFDKFFSDDRTILRSASREDWT